jgi:type IV secretory pathway ATPase VirB11/archaellum biosynthesis ATPase
MRLLSRFRESTESACGCSHSFDGPVDDDRIELAVDATDCPGEGDVAASPDCRAAVIDALAERDADVIRTRANGVERTYDGLAAALLLAAGKFVERVGFHDRSLAERARRDPLAAAREATGRVGPVADVAGETGLAECAERAAGYRETLRAHVGPTVARCRVSARAPPQATLVDAWELETGSSVRLYETPEGRVYHLSPLFRDLDADALATLDEAEGVLAAGAIEGGERAPGRAVRRVASDDDPVETLARVLRRHTRGLGILEDLFADGRLSDAFATAPVAENPVRVALDGECVPTNVRLTRDGAAALASRFRRVSGRAFSRASPTLDAVVEPRAGERVRVAGVTAPVSDGFGFAFRPHGGDAWTLPGLVANGTLPADAAALLSVAAERAAAGLVAGARGAGKTTLLGALLWELPGLTRTVVIEDSPELPVDALREAGRDAQRLRVDPGEGPAPAPAKALRTALRLGEGALVVGEVRGEEAATLYEAMRVGASGSAVLGTIHGDGAAAVRERVVSDLGVPESSFAATDLVVTLRGSDDRGVAAIEEVRADDGVRFEELFAVRGEGLTATGTVDRGNSALVADLARPGESYADVRDCLGERERTIAALARSDRTRPADVATAYREREA